MLSLIPFFQFDERVCYLRRNIQRQYTRIIIINEFNDPGHLRLMCDSNINPAGATMPGQIEETNEQTSADNINLSEEKRD